MPSIDLSCDEPDVRRALAGKASTELRLLIGANKLVLIDEAQRVAAIGLTIKLLADTALERLVQSVALQVGSEVSYNELARQVGVDKKTS